MELQRDCYKKDVSCRKTCPLENFFIQAVVLVLGVGLSQDKGQGQVFGKGESHNWSAAAKGLPKEGVGCKQNCPLGICSPEHWLSVLG